MLQRLGGLDVERLRHLDEYATHPLFDPVERRVLAYADAMTALPPIVTDSQVAELEAELGRAGLIELTHSIALENMRARAYHALGIVDQGFDTACQVRLSG
jgi:alkylhydroperoxidase family enzyme